MPDTQRRAARIFIVDDHPVIRRGLSQIIEDLDDMQAVGEARDADEALGKIAADCPDLVLIDVSLGDRGGIELIKELKSRYPELKMLVLSMHDESLFAERAVRAGALGYVNKNEPTDTLVSAMRQVLADQIFLSPRLTNRIVQRAASGSDQSATSPIESLSDRELEVFEMIGQGMITKQIAAKLNLSTKTIETYRENIKTKLKLGNSSELMRHAVQWVLEGG
jgi:DNA-binding NarL/FixJ family response regulator